MQNHIYSPVISAFSFILRKIVGTKRLTKNALTLALILTCILAKGQYHNLDFKPVDTNNFASQFHILCMLQDSQGFLWIGTFNGLYRYDGYTFSKFSSQDTSGVLKEFSHEVHALFEDDLQRLWVGTATGLFIINRITGHIRHITHNSHSKNSLSHNFIKSIVGVNKNLVLLGTYGGGLTIYDPKKDKFSAFCTSRNDSNSIPSNFINTIFIDSDTKIWIGTEGGTGIVIFDKDKKSFYSPSRSGQSLPDNTVNCIEEDSDGIWIGTWNKGLFKYEKSSGKFIHHDLGESKAGKTIRAIMKDWNGNLWLASYGDGLRIYNPVSKKITHYTYLLNKEKRKNHQFLWSLYKDSSDIIWVGSFGSGLYKYDRNKIRVSNFIEDESINNQIRDLAITVVMEDTHQNIWLGTLGNGVIVYNPHENKLIPLSGATSLSGSIIQVIYEDKKGRIWIGSDDGLYRINSIGSDVVFYESDFNTQNGLSDNGIYAIHEDSDGDMWLGLWGNGINVLQKKEIAKTDSRIAIFEKIEEDNSEFKRISKSNVWKIQEYKPGQLFLCTSQGLYTFNKYTKRLRRLNTDNVNGVYQDNQSRFWISTYGAGAVRYSIGKETFEQFNVEKGIISNIVYGFTHDTNGNTWLFADKGITRLRLEKGFLQNFTLQEDLGLVKMGHRGFCKLHNGQLLVGGEKGLRVFNPEEVNETISDNPVYITDIKILNKSIRFRDKKFLDIPSLKLLNLKYDENNISFEFSGLNFSGPEKIKYAYKLEGFDKEWIYTDATQRIATYANLNGGAYTFIVRAMNLNGSWNKQEAILHIEVIPAFWQTVTFKIFLLILLGSLIFLLVWIRERKIKENYLFKNELLRSERLIIENRELLSQRRIVEKELKEKDSELTASTLQIVNKNQALSSIRNELQQILPQVSTVFKRKLETIITQINQDLNDEGNWEKLTVNLNLIQDNFLSRFAETFPDITHKDLKICAYIRMNISNEEIARLLNISGRSLEMSRYRIRKKINLGKKIQLNDFIMRF